MEDTHTAIWINAKDKKIVPIEVHSLESIQACVGGFIEKALDLGDGHGLFVNKSGLYLNLSYGFMFKSLSKNILKIKGNGIILASDEGGDLVSVRNDTLDLMCNRIVWLS